MGKLIALLTDFGTEDIYVGVMKGVMKQICPDAEFVDISHNVARQSIHNGALLLRNSYKYFPNDTVFLVVIDPTVGSDRLPIIVSAGGYRFIAPDNGILRLTLEQFNDWTAYELGNIDYQLTDGSFTFHGRDIFAPGAAFAARGDVPLSAFGKQLNELITLPEPVLNITASKITGEITHIDHFGNVITSIGTFVWDNNQALLLSAHGQSYKINPKMVQTTVNGTKIDTIRTAYHEVGIGQLLLQIDSNGYLELAVNHGSASDKLEVSIHDTITLHLQ